MGVSVGDGSAVLVGPSLARQARASREKSSSGSRADCAARRCVGRFGRRCTRSHCAALTRPFAERTGLGRRASASGDDCALPRCAGPLCRTCRSPSALRDRRRFPPRPPTRRLSAAAHPARDCRRTDRSPPRRRRRRRRRRATSPSSEVDSASPRSRACRDVFSRAVVLAQRFKDPLHRPLRTASALRRSSSTSSAGIRGARFLILTPVAGSPRSSAW